MLTINRHESASFARQRRHHSHDKSRGQSDRFHHDQRDHDLDRLRQAARQHQGGSTERARRVGGELYRDFPDRAGYDANFLGSHLALPKLDESIAHLAAPLKNNPDEHVLNYTHFSIIQHKERRTPLLTAVNIDGSQYQEIERDGKWVFDGRLDRAYQMGNEAYSNNPIDKGHMVRRRDPMWGAQADQGQDDTFVYTNAALQHADLNQHEWLDLEDHILNSAVNQDRKVTVFTGPVFQDDDPSFDNQGKMDMPTQIPREFWKVVVWNEPGKGLRSEAFVMSQKDLLGKEPSGEEHIKETDFKTYRVPLAHLEEMTHLKFGGVSNSCQNRQRLHTSKSLCLS